MAVNFNIESKKFLTQFRNGDAFTDNPTEFTEILQGSVGDHTRLETVIRLDISVNSDSALIFDYLDEGANVGKISTFGVNFKDQGLVVGQVCDMIMGETNTDEITILSISGPGFNTLRFDNTNVSPWLISPDPVKNVEIRVKTRPNFLTYKYGINQDTTVTNNYLSPLDGTTQAYKLPNVTGSFQDMPRIGSLVSWDLTTSIEARFSGTFNTYEHEYEINHEFRPHWYIESELGNLLPILNNPVDLSGASTRKYVNGFFFGFDSPVVTGKFQDNFGTIGSGNLAYYDEALNGFPNNFTVTSIAVANASSTGVLEVSETNTVTAVITAGTTIFTATQKAIAHHTRLPSAAEYGLSFSTVDDIFVRDSQSQIAGDPATGSGVVSNMTVVQDSTTQITVEFDVIFTPTQQGTIDTGDSYILALTVGDEALTAETERPVKLLLQVTRYTKNLDQTGLITNWQPSYYDANAAYGGSRIFTDVKGWDGDVIGIVGNFNLVQTNDGSFRKLTSIKSRLIASDGTTEFTLFSKNLPVDPSVNTTSGGFIYVIVDITQTDNFNFPPSEPLTELFVTSVPAFPPSLQNFSLQTMMPRITWRDWIANAEVPAEFFDNTELQNNQNLKTSNYSGVLGFEVYHEFTVDVTKFVPGVGFAAFDVDVVTEYKLRSDHFSILDFDDAGGSTFSAVTKYYDINGDITSNLFIDQVVRIEVELTHAIGILATSDLWGMIWIGRDGGTSDPFQLHTLKDWTSDDNPLQPSDTLLTGNIQFVEITSVLNLVTLICHTNPGNLQENVTYNVYGRLGKKT